MFINDLFENKNVKEGWDEVKSRVGDVAKKTADTLVSAGAAAGDAVSGALDVIPRPFDEKTYQDRVSKPYPNQDRVSKPYPKTDKKKLDEEDSPEIGSTVNVTTVKGRTYTGELVRIDDNSVALRVYAAGGIPHAQNDTEPRSQIIVMKKDHVVSIEDALEEDIPPPENARKTQIASTLGTYKKAGAMLDKAGIQGKSLDFGAGLGKGTAELGKDAESYEPYPREDFKPNYIDATQIPSNSYSRIVNLNVLNVVPNVEGHRIRDEIVRQIGRVLAPGGMALITTRGRDVLTIKGTPGEEPMSMISSIGTYQKGFTSKELKEYVQSVLGDDFEVSSAKLGPAGVMIKKHKESVDETAAKDRLHQRHQEIRKQAGRPHSDYYKELRATFDLPDDERWAKVAELKKKYKVAESLRDGEHHTWTVYFDDGTSQQVNVPSDEFDVRGYFAKKGKKVTKVDKSYAVQGQQQDKVKPDNYDDRPDRAAKAQAAHDRDLTEGDDKFGSMMSKIASPESMDTSEALALIDDLMHQAGASYQEAVQQASVSYGIKPAKLNALYKQRESRDAFDGMFGGGNPASNLGIKEEQLDELSPKTLMSYSGKAQGDAKDRLTQVKAGAPNKKELISKAEKRVGGIKQAHSKVKDPEYGKKVVDEDWSNKYKRSIDCSNPKGFSQKAHCAGKKKNEGVAEGKPENPSRRGFLKALAVAAVLSSTPVAKLMSDASSKMSIVKHRGKLGKYQGSDIDCTGYKIGKKQFYITVDGEPYTVQTGTGAGFMGQDFKNLDFKSDPYLQKIAPWLTTKDEYILQIADYDIELYDQNNQKIFPAKDQQQTKEMYSNGFIDAIIGYLDVYQTSAIQQMAEVPSEPHYPEELPAIDKGSKGVSAIASKAAGNDPLHIARLASLANAKSGYGAITKKPDAQQSAPSFNAPAALPAPSDDNVLRPELNKQKEKSPVKRQGVDEDIERYVEALSRAGYEITEDATLCPECGGPAFEDKMLAEKQDACYHKVKSRYKVWPSAYASGALVRCRKAGAKNWGNKSKK
jgi:hypothetical protein